MCNQKGNIGSIMSSTGQKRKSLIHVVTTNILIICLIFTLGMIPVSQGETVAADTNGLEIQKQVVALGENHSAVIKSDGKLYTWGLNTSGQLGDRTVTNRTEPTAVYGLENVVSVSLGANHSAAITSDGSLYTWGNNSRGQLGYESSGPDNRKPHCLFDGNIVDVSLGTNHSAAVTADGDLYMWGNNTYGEIGIENTSDEGYQKFPVKVMEDVKAVSLGKNCSAAITSDGSLYTWGYNPHGQTGPTDLNNSKECITTPVKVFENVRSANFGDVYILIVKADDSLWVRGQYSNNQGTLHFDDRSCRIMSHVREADASLLRNDAVIRTDGSLWMRGSNQYGNIGDGTTNYASYFQKIMDSGTVNSVYLENGRSSAVLQDGSLWMWGKNGDYNLSLAGASEQQQPTPILVFASEDMAQAEPWVIDDQYGVIPFWDNDSPVVSCSIGGSRTAAVKADGSLWCWGNYVPTDNYLMTPSFETKTIPTFVMNDIVKASVRGDHLRALQNDGALWEYTGSIWPSACLDNVRDIYEAGDNIGYSYYATLQDNGELWMSGLNSFGQVGNGIIGGAVNDLEPVLEDLPRVEDVSLGYGMSAAITENGDLYTWGKNNYGQVGNGTTENQASPVKIMSDVIKVSIGDGHCAAVTQDGKLYTWGRNNYGQLGIFSNEDQTTPVRVEDWADVTDVGAGGNHTAAIRSDGTLWTWGYNNYYQLGLTNHNNEPEYGPSQVQIDPVESILMSGDCSTALTKDGNLYFWGYMPWYKSISSNEYVRTPMRIMDGVRDYDLYALGRSYGHGAAIRKDGSLWTWGCNGDGQIGNGTTETQPTPVQIWPSNGVVPQVDPKDLNFAQITLNPASASYTGSAIKPKVTVVSYDNKTLKEDTDFEVSYKDNTNAGTATVTVSGKGAYTGSIDKTFRINAISINGASISEIPDQAHTGNAVEPTITVTKGEIVLKKDQDYTVSYENNIELGTATVKVSGTGNYSGTIQTTFEITEEGSGPSGPVDPQDKQPLTGATFSDINAVTYTGEAIRPDFEVTLGDETLTEEKDYTVDYSNNTNAGTALITITGTGEEYVGSASTTFKINKRSMSTLRYTIRNVPYTGKKLRPKVRIEYSDAMLVKGTDYTISGGRKKIGKGKITIKGKGNYTGSVKKKFTVIPEKLRIKSKKTQKDGTKTRVYLKVRNLKHKTKVKYRVQMCPSRDFKTKVDSKTFKLKAKGMGPKKIKVRNKLKKGKQYYVRVQVIYGKYKGPWSNIETITGR